MKLQFNQSGAWRNGPDFDATTIEAVKHHASILADITGAKLRILNDHGQVELYYTSADYWQDVGTGPTQARQAGSGAD